MDENKKIDEMLKNSLIKSKEEAINFEQKNEKLSLLVAILAQFFWSINGLQLKLYYKYWPNIANYHTIIFYRAIPLWLFGYLLARKHNNIITPHKEIKHFLWLMVRCFGNYFGIIFWIIFVSFFRISTCQCFISCNPIVVFYMSVFFLKEKFYYRYIIGILICIIGNSIIIMNERGQTTIEKTENKNKKNIFLGILAGISHLLTVSITTFSQKILAKDQMNADEQNYYLGMYNTLPALLCMILILNFSFNIPYICFTISNGIIFYIWNHCTAIALKNLPLSKFIPTFYMNIIFTYIFGFIFLGEKVYFTDIIGSLMILGFQVYNVWVPN